MTGHEEDFTRMIKCRTKHETKTPRRRGTMPLGLGHKNRKKSKMRKNEKIDATNTENRRKNEKTKTLFLVN